jgi:hypothetical protein
MDPDNKRLADDALGVIDINEPALQDLFAVCAESFNLVAGMAVGRKEEYKVIETQRSHIEAHESWSKLDQRDKNRVSRQFIAFAFTIVAQCWGDDTSKYFDNYGDSIEDKRNTLSVWISLLEPMILAVNDYSSGESYLSIREIQSALSALNTGETPDLFRPSVRKGKELNAHTLAIKKISFIKLLRELTKFNLTPQQINKIAGSAVGVQPDTRRKWEAAAKPLLTPGDVARINDDHRHFMETEPSQNELEAQLLADGESLRIAMGHKPRLNTGQPGN